MKKRYHGSEDIKIDLRGFTPVNESPPSEPSIISARTGNIDRNNGRDLAGIASEINWNDCTKFKIQKKLAESQ